MPVSIPYSTIKMWQKDLAGWSDNRVSIPYSTIKMHVRFISGSQVTSFNSL